jgi:hypothetical protein
MLKILNTVENYYYRWDLEGKVSFKSDKFGFQKRKNTEAKMISHFPAKNGPLRPAMTLRDRK